MMSSAQPPQPGQPADPAASQQTPPPWYLKWAAKGLGAIGGLIAIGLGAFNCFTLTPLYLLSGIWQILAGFMVTILEAPFLCMFLDFVQNISQKMDSMTQFVRAALYIGIAIPAVLMCQNFSIIIGSGLIFSTGVLYGLMALGRKADRKEMMQNATSDKAPIVDSAQPMGMA